jgi:hypothetical protein
MRFKRDDHGSEVMPESVKSGRGVQGSHGKRIPKAREHKKLNAF